MKLPDVNLLIYAYDSTSPYNEGARSWLQDVLSGPELIGFTWQVLLGFVRISTRPQVFSRPLEPSEAFGFVEGWLARSPRQ